MYDRFHIKAYPVENILGLCFSTTGKLPSDPHLNLLVKKLFLNRLNLVFEMPHIWKDKEYT